MRKWLVVLLLVPGCAFALSGPDPDRPRNQPPRCDTTKGLVVLDGLVATGMGIAALSLTAADEPAVALLPAAIGALFIGGAVRGNNNVNACRAAMDGYAMSMGHGPLPDESQEPGSRVSPIATAPMEPAVNPQPVAPPPVVPPPAQPPVAPPPPAPPATQPPVAQQPPQPRAPMTKMRPRTDDEWGEFWKEVP